MKKYFKITFILSFLFFQFYQLVAQDSDLVLQTEMEKDAFLLAQITGWKNLDLISEPMNVYQGEFESYLVKW